MGGNDNNEFLAEAEELTESLSKGLSAYEKALAIGGKINPDLLNGIFRTAHTLKGLAGTFERQDMSDLAHKMENLLDKMRLGKVKSDENVINILFAAAGMLQKMLKSKVEEQKISALVQKLNSAAENELKTQSLVQNQALPQSTQFVLVEGAHIPLEIHKVLSEYEECRLRENIRDNYSIVIVSVAFSFEKFDKLLPKLTAWLNKIGEVIATLPSSEPQTDNKMHFQLLVGTDCNLDKLASLLKAKHRGQGLKARPSAADTQLSLNPEIFSYIRRAEKSALSFF